jgi:hypothetical protein
MSDAKGDLEAAFARLIMGEPTNPQLIKSAAAGRLRVNIATVALEAGRSRTLIGHDNCPFPDLRRRILELKNEGPTARHARHALKIANRRIAELTKQLAERDSIQAALVLDRERMRREAEAIQPRIVRTQPRP